MARRIKNSVLDSRDARVKLKARGKPYWTLIGRGLHLGYRKGKTGGSWVLRRYLGHQSYEVETIAQADDKLDANGSDVLNFWQVQERAREMRPRRGSSGSSYTVKHAIDDYLVHLEDRPSARDVKYRLMAYATPLLDRPVVELEADELRKWHRDIAKKPARLRTTPGARQKYRHDESDEEAVRRRKASANNCLSMLKSALNHAYREDKVKELGAWRKVKPHLGVNVPRSVYLNVVECKRLINAAQGDFRVLVRAALETGARISELIRLRVRDFNRDAGTLHVRKSKTHKDRHILLTQQGRDFFASLVVGKADTDVLLGREWSPMQYKIPLLEACRRAGIKTPIVFHSLRHTWASLAVMNGVPLMVVAKNLGHADTRQVEKTYGHLAKGYVATEIDARAPRYDLVDEPSKVRTL
jgi:integrase